jgi:ABC-type transport system involved in multi-copper enzyme maturation permease subunit
MSKLISEYSTKLKSFRYLSYLLLLISVTYLLSGIIDGDKQSLSESVSIGLLGIFAGGFLFYFAQKKRTIQIYDDKIEYLKPKIDFSANWDDVVLVKSFKEINKETENLIIMKKDDDILSISTAFFDRNKLVSAYNDIRNLQKNNEKVTFEDDRLWGK